MTAPSRNSLYLRRLEELGLIVLILPADYARTVDRRTTFVARLRTGGTLPLPGLRPDPDDPTIPTGCRPMPMAGCIAAMFDPVSTPQQWR